MTASQTTTRCLPTYVLVDVSGSMRPVEDALNDAIESLCGQLTTVPGIAELAHVSIIAFGTDATIALPITDVQQLRLIPEVECGGVSNLGSAFRLVRQCIDRDIDQLHGNGVRVLRPVVFVLTDGIPTDADGRPTESWRADHASLIDENWRRHPNVVSFGFGNATVDMIRAIATHPGAAFLTTEPGPVGSLPHLFSGVLRNLVASAQTGSGR